MNSPDIRFSLYDTRTNECASTYLVDGINGKSGSPVAFYQWEIIAAMRVLAGFGVTAEWIERRVVRGAVQ